MSIRLSPVPGLRRLHLSSAGVARQLILFLACKQGMKEGRQKAVFYTLTGKSCIVSYATVHLFI